MVAIKARTDTHVGIVDNLLYTFTKPFDIVVAPFAGGGSTIDLCKKWPGNRRVSTQLSLLDLVEGARRTNLNAQVSRSNTLNQIQAAQAQARYARQSNERMAQFQAAQQRQMHKAIAQQNTRVAPYAADRNFVCILLTSLAALICCFRA